MSFRKQSLCVLLVLFCVSALSGCVTEKQQTHVFKEPTKADLANAISEWVAVTYKYVEAKNYEQAMVNVKHALDIDKDSPAAITALAVVYESQGDTDKARASFQRAIELNDKFSLAHLYYGQFLFQKKESADACRQFQKATEDDFFKQRAFAFYDLGLCYREVGDIEKSEAALNRCIGLDPNSASAFGVLATIRFGQQRYPESKELLDKYYKILRVVSQQPSPDMVWLGIKLAHRFGNQDEEASLALFLKNTYPTSKENLEYQQSLKK